MTDDDTTPFLDEPDLPDLPDIEEAPEVEPDPEPKSHDDADQSDLVIVTWPA